MCRILQFLFERWRFSPRKSRFHLCGGSSPLHENVDRAPRGFPSRPGCELAVLPDQLPSVVRASARCLPPDRSRPHCQSASAIELSCPLSEDRSHPFRCRTATPPKSPEVLHVASLSASAVIAFTKPSS